jgi:Transposase DDE domain
LRVAYCIARQTLPAYSHRCSPKKFTQHQLFACLVLKEFFKLDYRGIEALLAENESLRAVIELRVAPDFTTLHKACRRLLRMASCNELLDRTVRWARKTPLLTAPVALAAIDSSGFEAHRASNYFVRRRAPHGKQTGKWQVTTYRRFPKLGLVCDCSSHFILAAVPHRGPSPDFDHWSRAMADARSRVRMKTMLADAGYDAEWIHLAARLVFQTRTLIPPKHGRPTKKLPRQYYRRRMARIFNKRRKRKPYRQRSQVETVFSVLKRRLDSSVNAHSYWSQCRALMLKALTHNIMLLRQKQVFDRAT